MTDRGTRTEVVTTRNARFQQWQSYLNTRAKRTKAGLFVVQGVRPLTLAAERGWPLDTVMYRLGGGLSEWARHYVESAHDTAGVSVVGVSAELMEELGEKDGRVPEVLAVARTRWADLREWAPAGETPVVVVFDRPASPGNLGTLVRSADAFGAQALVITGHGADPFDPVAVRASTGSVFALPVAQAGGPSDVLDFASRQRERGVHLTVVGTDETGEAAIDAHDFTGGTVLVVGNETRGMSAAWREACDVVVNVPIGGAASSLGAPSAGAVALYETARQRSRRSTDAQ